MIWELAGDFITMGDTPQERQGLLIAACTSWNIVCNPPMTSNHSLDRYLREYQRFNPGADEQELVEVRNDMNDMEELIQRKVKMFPNDLRQIVGARIFKSGGKNRVEILSARSG